jgi:hypothetical protein
VILIGVGVDVGLHHSIVPVKRLPLEGRRDRWRLRRQPDVWTRRDRHHATLEGAPDIVC